MLPKEKELIGDLIEKSVRPKQKKERVQSVECRLHAVGEPRASLREIFNLISGTHELEHTLHDRILLFLLMREEKTKETIKTANKRR